MGVIARGQTAVVSVTVRDGDGELANASGIAVAITDPLGAASATPAVVHDALGAYHADWAVASDADLGTYAATWTGTVDAAPWTAVDLWLVVVSAAVVTPFTSVEDVRALVPSALTDEQLATVISREEAWLARRIGVLAGPRTQTFHIRSATAGMVIDPGAWTANVGVTSDRMGPLGLGRPTGAVTVTDGGVAVDAADVRLLRGGTAVERASGGWTGPTVAVAYTPDDAEEVRRAVIELVRLTTTESGYASERIGEYSYTRGAGGSGSLREALVRSLVTHGVAGTTRIPSSSEDDRIGAVGAA